MPGKREDLPHAGTGTDTDLKPLFTYEELTAFWDKLIEANRINERQEGDMTASEFAAEIKLGRTAAREILDRLVKEGKLLKIKGRRAIFYRPV
jgi:hypothetical protein